MVAVMAAFVGAVLVATTGAITGVGLVVVAVLVQLALGNNVAELLLVKGGASGMFFVVYGFGAGLLLASITIIFIKVVIFAVRYRFKNKV